MENTYSSGTNLVFYLMIFVLVSVLPSMHTPLVNDLVDRSDRSRVQAQLTSLKTAFLSYKSDMRHLPFLGSDPSDASAYEKAWQHLFADNASENMLISSFTPVLGASDKILGMTVKQYKSRWKGPYLFYETPTESLIDAWGNPIAYYSVDDGKFLRIFLHSAGQDGRFDITNPELTAFSEKLSAYKSFSLRNIIQFGQYTPTDAHSNDYAGDDIIMQIDRIRKKPQQLTQN